MNVQAQRVVISSTGWRQVSSDTPQELIKRPLLFYLHISELDNKEECTLCKFTDDTKPGGVADTAECYSVVLSNLDKLENWASGNLMKFNQWKCQVLHQEKNNPMEPVRDGDLWAAKPF